MTQPSGQTNDSESASSEDSDGMEYTLHADRYDTGEMVVEFDPDDLDADLLYDLIEAVEINDDAVRVAELEIERRNVLNHDNYRPKFTLEMLTTIATSLLIARVVVQARGDIDHANAIKRFGQILHEETDGAIDLRIAKEMRLGGIRSTDDEPLHLIDALRGEQSISYSTDDVEETIGEEIVETPDPEDYDWT